MLAPQALFRMAAPAMSRATTCNTPTPGAMQQRGHTAASAVSWSRHSGGQAAIQAQNPALARLALLCRTAGHVCEAAFADF